MQPTLSGTQLGWFMAFAPITIGLIIYLVTYATKRGEGSIVPPLGQSFACAKCGKRSVREHMVPANFEGAVAWYCNRCSTNRT
ncbi:MAG TPA: hypothetical protein VMV73_04015 [Candidatus Dormibacteraeota bacterium]|nr:hypothetical protein [Candidatus Dormibacteraeota bacterium]